MIRMWTAWTSLDDKVSSLLAQTKQRLFLTFLQEYPPDSPSCFCDIRQILQWLKKNHLIGASSLEKWKSVCLAQNYFQHSLYTVNTKENKGRQKTHTCSSTVRELIFFCIYMMNWRLLRKRWKWNIHGAIHDIKVFFQFTKSITYNNLQEESCSITSLRCSW